LNSRFDQRYFIVAAAFIIQGMIIGSMFAYGVFFKVLEEELGWSRTLLAGSSSLSFVMMGVFAMVGGRLNDRFGPRWVMSISGVLFGLGYALMYFMSAPWQLFVLYGVFIGIGLSTHDVVTLSTVARWFKQRRGIMTGVVKIGTACGQITLPLLATALIAAFGWRVACVILGLAVALIVVLVSQLLRRGPQPNPPSNSTSKDSRSTATPVEHREPGLSFAQAKRTRQFWTLCAAQFMFFPSLVTMPVHIVAHGTDLGMEPVHAAAVLSAIGAISILGRLFVGGAADRIGGRRAMLVCFTMLLSGLIWLHFADSGWMLFVFAALYGFAHGGFFTVVSPTVAEFFGMRAHGAIFGVVLFSGTVSGALGPLTAGAIFDASGSYQMAFSGLALMAFIGLLLTLSLRPLERPTGELALGVGE
jgi:MFS family permease